MRRILALVAVGGLALAGCGGDGDSAATATTTSPALPASTTSTAVTAPPTTVAAPTASTVPVRPTIAEVKLSGGSQAEGYTWEVAFPTVSGPAATSVRQSVNDRVRAELTAAVDEFVAAAKELPPGPGPGPSALTSTGYTVDRLDERLLSFRQPVSRYFSGAAHPGRVLLTFTFDLRTGRRLELADLFAPGAPYLDRLSELSRPLLLAQPGFDGFTGFEGGTAPTAENFAHWTVTEQELVITFDEYQVAPYAMGTPHVSIPFASVRTLLDPAGPLAIQN